VIPAPLRGRHITHVRVAYLGDAEMGSRLVEPMRAVGPCLRDTLADMPYAESGSIYNDPTEPHAYHGSNVMLSGLSSTAMQTLFDLAGPDAAVPCVVDLRQLGGALARTPTSPNAVGHRDAAYLLRLVSPLTDLSAVRAAHRRIFAAMAPWSTGGRSLNFIYGDQPEQVREAYEPADYRRLTSLKAGYDPANLFRLGQNIPPAQSPAESPDRNSAVPSCEA
jgi:hypothetical protein